MLGTLFLGDDEITNDTSPAEPWVDDKRLETIKLDDLGKLVGVKGRVCGSPLDEGASEHWMIPISAQFVAALAKLDAKKRPGIAKKWGETGGWEMHSTAGIATLLADMVELAARAVEDEKPMFLWMSL